MSSYAAIGENTVGLVPGPADLTIPENAALYSRPLHRSGPPGNPSKSSLSTHRLCPQGAVLVIRLHNSPGVIAFQLFAAAKAAPQGMEALLAGSS